MDAFGRVEEARGRRRPSPSSGEVVLEGDDEDELDGRIWRGDGEAVKAWSSNVNFTKLCNIASQSSSIDDVLSVSYRELGSGRRSLTCVWVKLFGAFVEDLEGRLRKEMRRVRNALAGGGWGGNVGGG
jgi:hypothetical protein